MGNVVRSADAFFLHVETAGAPQHVGGLVVFETTGDDRPSVDQVREVVRNELVRLPRFRQRLARSSYWRRPRWVEADDIDWSSHVMERRTSGGRVGLCRVVADAAETAISRDRPMWRIMLVTENGSPRERASQMAMVLLVHHAIADGNGIVSQALNLLRPRIELSRPSGTAPGRVRLAAATIAGLAQLATDGGAGSSLASSPRREFATADLDLATVRRVAAARHVRVTDVVLALVGDAVAATHREVTARVHGRLRVAVPLTVRRVGIAAETNATAGVMVDVPVDGRPIEDLITEVGRRTTRIRTPSRAAASRFVLATGLRALPEPAAAWFARTVYGRRFFHAIVSNMQGSPQPLSMAGVGIAQVYPILPLAPGAPLAVGALSWSGSLGIGITTDPASMHAAALATHLESTFTRLPS
ncbi:MULTISPECIES: wax ester/triacylglycerol synthase domain-containing protein [unclassified Kribbella]|uniref:wax ester/triacylglycerol synthase domain-containing protein n=1 Tax=unclassified Kribbella TaxID=2644121 RepID=UPI003076C77D